LVRLVAMKSLYNFTIPENGLSPLELFLVKIVRKNSAITRVC
jgi:hypothetical protein